MPGDAKYMFGGADKVLGDIRRRKEREKTGLLMPKKKKEKIVRFRVNDQWLSIEECIARGISVKVKIDDKFVNVNSNNEILKHLRLPKDSDFTLTNKRNDTKKQEPPIFEKGETIVDIINHTFDLLKEDGNTSNKVLTKEDIEKQIDIVKNELKLLYDMKDANEISMIHKEGQIYAYKSLLNILNKK